MHLTQTIQHFSPGSESVTTLVIVLSGSSVRRVGLGPVVPPDTVLRSNPHLSGSCIHKQAAPALRSARNQCIDTHAQRNQCKTHGADCTVIETHLSGRSFDGDICLRIRSAGAAVSLYSLESGCGGGNPSAPTAGIGLGGSSAPGTRLFLRLRELNPGSLEPCCAVIGDTRLLAWIRLMSSGITCSPVTANHMSVHQTEPSMPGNLKTLSTQWPTPCAAASNWCASNYCGCSGKELCESATATCSAAAGTASPSSARPPPSTSECGSAALGCRRANSLARSAGITLISIPWQIQRTCLDKDTPATEDVPSRSELEPGLRMERLALASSDLAGSCPPARAAV
eukprot:2390113-Rhodomonas_salina.1